MSHRRAQHVVAVAVTLAAALLPSARAAAQPTNHVYIGGGYERSPYDYGYGPAATTGCQFDQTSSGAVSAGGVCNVYGGPGPSQTLTITTGASVDAGGLLHATGHLVGSIPRVPITPSTPYGYSAGTDVFAASSDFLTITQFGAMSPGASLVFDLFLHGTATATIQNAHPKPVGSPENYHGDDVFAAGDYTVTLFTSEDEGSAASERLYQFSDQTSPSTGTIVVPFAALVFTGNTARVRAEQLLESYVVANIDPFFPGAVVVPGSTEFDVFGDFGNTAGFSNVRVLDANGNDVSAAYGLQTSTQQFGVTATPEPVTFALVGLGLLTLAGVAPRRRAA